MYRFFWMTMVTSLALALGVGCTDDDCPVGQVLFEGECVEVLGQDPECGPGTYNLNGVCWPHEDVCGPNTEVVFVLDASGVETNEFYCEGQKITDVPACPESPDGELICVSGWAKYLMDPDNPCIIMETDIVFGPDATALEVAIYDPLAYASNPTTAPLGVADVNPENGTWKVENIPVPTTEFIAVVIRSIDPLTDFLFTGFPYGAKDGINVEEVVGYGITSEQNAAWSAAITTTAIGGAANCNPGETLYDCGSWIGVFGYELASGGINFLEGVTPYSGANEIPVTDVHYLDDTCEGFIQPASMAESYTTSTGVAIMAGARLGNFHGVCADLDPDSECETEGYSFEPRLGGALPQALFVQLEYPIGFAESE